MKYKFKFNSIININDSAAKNLGSGLPSTVKHNP